MLAQSFPKHALEAKATQKSPETTQKAFKVNSKKPRSNELPEEGSGTLPLRRLSRRKAPQPSSASAVKAPQPPKPLLHAARGLRAPPGRVQRHDRGGAE